MLINRLNMGLLSIILIGGVVGCDSQSTDAQQVSEPQAIPVDVISIAKTPTTIYTELPARVVATRMSEVRPQVTGILQKRLFEEGQKVERGELLYQIDPAPYQADVNSAQAALIKAKADESVLKKTALRYKGLVQRNLISQEEYDKAEGNWQQAKAQSAVAQAALENAKISLSYTQVTAPISGRIDISNVTEGALVTANQETALTTIQPLDPIYIDMTQSSLSMAKIKKGLGANTNPKVGVQLEDGTEYKQVGSLTFSGTKVDPSTGSVTLRAKVPNPDSILLPGMFVRAEIITADQKPMYTLSQALVIFGQGGKASVYVVEKGKAVIRSVKTGATVNGNEWIIESGLNKGDQVITSNLMKIRPNVPVQVISNKSHDVESTQE